MTYLKENNLLMLVLSLCIGLAMIVGCEGPEGPQGPAGPEGPEGPEGEQGPQGEEGTANVIYSDWMTPDSWEPVEFFGDSVRYGDLIAPDLSQEIVDSGEVNVYANFINADFVYKLPIDADMAGVGTSLNFKIKPDTVRLIHFDPDNPNTDPGSYPSGNKFRYVLIPGGQSASSSTKAKGTEIQDMSYQELKEHFDIPDEGSGVIRNARIK